MIRAAWEPWGHSRFRLPDQRTVRLYRKGQRCRWIDEATQEQVGPEQSNVCPALAAAFAAGWSDISAHAADDPLVPPVAPLPLLGLRHPWERHLDTPGVSMAVRLGVNRLAATTPPADLRVIRLTGDNTPGLRHPLNLVADAALCGSRAVEAATGLREVAARISATRAAHLARLALGAASLLLALALPARALEQQTCAADTDGAGGGCVNVNTATAAELAHLHRIGPALAERIVAEREAGGEYMALYQLAERVKGVGPLTVCYNQRAMLTSGETTRTESYKPEVEVVDACKVAEEPADYCHDC